MNLVQRILFNIGRCPYCKKFTILSADKYGYHSFCSQCKVSWREYEIYPEVKK